MDSTYVAGLTEVDGLKTGWKLIRIPLVILKNGQYFFKRNKVC